MSIAVEQLARGPHGLVIQCLRNIGPYENNIFIVSDEATREASSETIKMLFSYGPMLRRHWTIKPSGPRASCSTAMDTTSAPL